MNCKLRIFDIKELRAVLERLAVPTGVSGDEDNILNIFGCLIMPYADESMSDAFGNFYAVKRGASRRGVVIEAHADGIGFMISEVHKDGFYSFTNLCNIDEKILPGSEVVINGSEFGVIGHKPPHIKDKDQCPGESVIEATPGFNTGDFVCFHSPVKYLLNDRVACGMLDNRLGLLVLATLAKEMAETQLPFDLYLAATRAEELGLKGGKAMGLFDNMGFDDDWTLITVDGCHGDTPWNKPGDDCIYPLGAGTVITVGPSIDRGLSSSFVETAKQNAIPYMLDVDTGNPGTSSYAAQVRGFGVRAGLLSYPVRYMHTQNEVADLRDVYETIRLLAAWLGGMVDA